MATSAMTLTAINLRKFILILFSYLEHWQNTNGFQTFIEIPVIISLEPTLPREILFPRFAGRSHYTKDALTAHGTVILVLFH